MPCVALGPGPGAYKLPSTVGYPEHDPSRYRNPMFSFGTAGKSRPKTLGPGPVYRIERVTRDGVEYTPAWSFGYRFPNRAITRTPGPGAHAPERCPPMRDPRAPAYSMGARLGYGARKTGPAPNAYALRLGIGSPAYTMGYKLGYSVKPKSPGPAVYYQKEMDVYMNRKPIYSLGYKSPGMKVNKSPGPAAYPPNLYNVKKAQAAYSFGIHHSNCAPPMIIKEDTMDCL